MPIFERGDIVATPYPYAEYPVVRRRPALVIATGLGPNRDLAWVLMITSASNQSWPGDVPITTDVDVSGLRSPSVVRTAKVTTIESDVARRVGELMAADLAAVEAALIQALAPTLP